MTATWTMGLALAAGLCASAPTSAQQAPAAPPPPGAPPALARPMALGPFGDLSEEQRTALREAFRNTNEQSRELNEKMRLARKDLTDAIYADKVDEAAIRAKADAVGKLEGDLAVVRAKAFAPLQGKLKPEQLDRIKNMRPEVGERAFTARPAAPLRPQVPPPAAPQPPAPAK